MARIAFLAFSILCGLLVAAFGVIIGAGGHGWVAASVSATALLTAPAGAAAWLLRRSRRGRRVAFIVLAVNGAIDVLFVLFSAREGFAYAVEAFDHAAFAVLAWAALWVGWQLVPVLSLVNRRVITAGRSGVSC
jgi:hypothetical protein